MAHWVYRFHDGSYLSHRKAPKRYAETEEVRGTLDEARVFNSASAASNAGNYPGKYRVREHGARGQAMQLDRINHL